MGDQRMKGRFVGNFRKAANLKRFIRLCFECLST